MQNTAETFLSQVNPHLGNWSSIDLRIIAQAEKDGRFHFSAVRAVLDAAEGAEVPLHRNLPSVAGLFVSHERWDISRLDEIVGSMTKGEIASEGKSILVNRWDGQDWRPTISTDYRFRDRSNSLSEFGIDFACFTLGTYDTRTRDYEQLRLLDGALRSHSPPWDGLADLRQDFLRLPSYKAERADLASFDIIAPLGLRLGAVTKMTRRSLTTSVDLAKKTDPTRAKLAALVRQVNGETQRTLHSVSAEKQNRIRLKLPGSTSKVTLLLSYGEIDVDRLEVFTSTSPRLDVMQQLGISPQGLRSLIEQAQGRELEQSLGILLHLLGFSPASYGGTKRSVPDIVAFPSNGTWVLVVECTEGEPDLSNKLTKLSTRAKLVGQIASRIAVHPVLVTTTSRRLLNQTDMEKASKEHIAVLTIEDMGPLIQMAQDGQDPERVLNHILTRVPSTSFGGSYS